MNENVLKIIKHPVTIPAVTGVLAFAAGGAAGYFKWGRHHKGDLVLVEMTHDEHPTIDFSDALATGPLFKEDPVHDEAQRLLEEARAAIEGKVPKVVVEADLVDNVPSREEVIEILPPAEEPELIQRNVFDGEPIDWDFDEEHSKRTSETPYVIHKDEMWSEEAGYIQETLTYYAGDDTMVDQEDKPLYNYGDYTGELMFGKGSGDVNVFYVRNDVKQREYEVVKTDSSYQIEVLGLEADAEIESELRHANFSRFREED